MGDNEKEKFRDWGKRENKILFVEVRGCILGRKSLDII